MNNKIHGTELNFDEWRVLAKTDPEAFERRRREVLETCIVESPDYIQPHLRRLQWRIDMERRYHWRNPLVAVQRLYGMMCDSVYAEDGLLPVLRRYTQGLEADAPDARVPSQPPATVLRFKTDAKPR